MHYENVVCSFSPNCRRLNVLTIPALHISVYFSCRQESLLWILMWEWYNVNARSYLYLCQWEPNMDWQSVMSTRVGESMSPRWPRYWHHVVFICCWTLCLWMSYGPAAPGHRQTQCWICIYVYMYMYVYICLQSGIAKLWLVVILVHHWCNHL